MAFDISRQSFRTREYAEYKGTRGETPPEFKGQVPLLQDALQAMGVRTIEKEDFEADDILATLAARGAEGYRVLLVSGDRDTIQLVNDDVTLLYPNTQGVSQLKRYDTAAVIERYGIRPEQYPDVAALVGESSDNLIGISKVGEKTAVKWLGLYGDLDGILAHADEIKGVVGQNLRDQRENAEPQSSAEPARARRAARRRARRARRQADRPRFGAPDLRAARVPHADGARRRSSRPARPTATAARLPRRRPAAAPPRRPAPGRADPRTLLDEELAAWLERAVTAEPAGLGLSLECVDGRVIGAGIATSDETVRLPWQPGPRRVRARSRRGSRARPPRS